MNLKERADLNRLMCEPLTTVEPPTNLASFAVVAWSESASTGWKRFEFTCNEYEITLPVRTSPEPDLEKTYVDFSTGFPTGRFHLSGLLDQVVLDWELDHLGRLLIIAQSTNLPKNRLPGVCGGVLGLVQAVLGSSFLLMVGTKTERDKEHYKPTFVENCEIGSDDSRIRLASQLARFVEVARSRQS